MDPIQLIWEVSKALFVMISALAVPVVVLWFVAHHQKGKRDQRSRSRQAFVPDANGPGDTHD